MSDHTEMRRLQVLTASVMLICFVALLTAHAGSHGAFVACVLFFPMFLFGLLDLSGLLRGMARMEEALLPQAPVLSALFQRPPPSLN